MTYLLLVLLWIAIGAVAAIGFGFAAHLSRGSESK